MKLVIFLSIVIFLRVKAWTSIRNPFELFASQHHYTTLKDCMHVASEEGYYLYKKTHQFPNGPLSSLITKKSDIIDDLNTKMTVCGLYVVADPGKIIEFTIKHMDVDCESGGLMAFVDGWELNGQYFPGINDHVNNINNRIDEFCDDNSHWPAKDFRRKYRSKQNAALLQYRIPIRGSFLTEVKFLDDLSPCNTMVDGLAPFYSLTNFGSRNNCTLTALFPAVISIQALSVGGKINDVNYDCTEENKKDKLIVGGSNGLDSYNMEISNTICGNSDKNGPEQAIFCGVTSVRLSSSGNYENQAIVLIRPADENDLNLATLVCQL